MPMAPRSTTGILSRPLLMYCTFAIWLINSPMASRMKSMNMKSTTGRAPAMAAPVHNPTKPRSVIGVSRSRSGPKRSYSPRVVVKLPPRAPMPSPTTKIDGSLAMASARTSRVASTNVISRMGGAPGFAVDIARGCCPVRPGRGLREFGGLFDHGFDLGVDGFEVGGRGGALRAHPGLQALERIARLPGLDFLHGPVAAIAHALG